ncbi:MAG: HesA/MoeB/ThiF family protein [Candidatus Bathyarchaeota archaeon]|nr:MAG: HesA/MoeB/ThiF family protein [Candidatus Bathyarchaeota archaeon]
MMGTSKTRKKVLENFLESLPEPPKEHAHELEMETRLRRLIAEEDLSKDELKYYSRQIVLDDIGLLGQRQLKASRVCIVGLGGLGSTTATQLAAMGIGHLRLVDRDIVEESNLQRQHLYSFNQIGVPKVEAASRRLKGLNPYISLEPRPIAVSEDNAEQLIEGVDVVVDGLDNMDTRYALNRACVKSKIPYVFGSAVSTYGNASTIIPRETPCLECFYGKLDDEKLPSCATIGVHPSILGIISSIEAAETVRILLGTKPNLSSLLLYCDVNRMQFEEIHLARVESCPICGSKPTGKSKKLERSLVKESCGRENRRVFIVTPKENLDLQIEKLVNLLPKKDARIKVKAQLGICFTWKQDARLSVLRSGVMIAEGLRSEQEVIQAYKTIVSGPMDIPWIRIEP